MHTPQPAERRLIINADDFGLAGGVNQAILELNAANVLPSATLMATGAAFRDAVHAAFQQASLGVGCHVVLVDGRPQSHPSQLPTLAPAGQLRSSLNAFTLDLFAGRISPQEIESEAIAQIRKVQSAGITVTHLDTHKHTHMFPRVLRPLIRAALACRVPAIRNPFEPSWSLRVTRQAPAARHLQVRTLRLF
ncbi:MAG TPA: ChbG/HpnK family deacetylase, partial [Acidobacteriaceae bacterium]